MNHILFFGFEENHVNQLKEFLQNSNYLISFSTDYADAIEIIESGTVNLSIINTEEDGNAFKSFKLLEPFLNTKNIPVFLVIDQENLNLVMIACEIGIDNIIFRPFNLSMIEKQIQNQFEKIRKVSIKENESFLSFFENNMIPMLTVNQGIVSSFNQAFSGLFLHESGLCINKEISQIFDFENAPDQFHQYKRLEAGLISFCTIENISLIGENFRNFHLFMVQDTLGNIIVQVNSTKDLEINSLGSSENNVESPTFPNVNCKLTKREFDIYKLSANGLPIKIIAQELNISPRTVEKHRANIMGKVGARNMIEAINIV
jgi:DNA-binding CsgD family transcriptional regulator